MPSFRNEAIACFAVLALSGCSSPVDPGRDVACRPLAPATVARRAMRRHRATTPFRGSVFTIVMENRCNAEIFAPGAAPFVQSLLAQGALAAGYRDTRVHPSEPNYLWMVAGENFGIVDDGSPSEHHVACASHVADQVERAGLDWRSYQEGMGEPCGLVTHDGYDTSGNPFVYFDDVNGWDGERFHPEARCAAHVVDHDELDRDIAHDAVPAYAFITPTLAHSMHDGSVAEGDAWLASEVPKIMASDAYRRGGVIFLLWDEGSKKPACFDGVDSPPFLVVSPFAKAGWISRTPYDTSSYLATVEAILGVDRLPCDPSPSSVATMDDLFTVPVAD